MLKNFGGLFISTYKLPLEHHKCNFHVGKFLNAWGNQKKPTDNWLKRNDVVFPPQQPNEAPRSAFICHTKENIKYSYKKLWYIASLIRGLSIDEALKQLSFVHKKGAVAITETLLEAQEMAVRDHNVEFKTNLWVSESYVGKGITIKGLRRHARARRGEIRHGYTHYFLQLEEGKPPEHYYPFKRKKSSEELLSDWLQGLRDRKISSSL